MTIKRKVVQHGPSTLIISLPSKWTKRHNLNKGDELEVEEKDDEIIISSFKREKLEKVELDITPYKEMIPRLIHALYKKGIDELILRYDSPLTFSLIQKALGKEAIGFEMLETSNNHCTIKNVSEGGKEFDKVLRQTFIILLSMAEEGYELMKQDKFEQLQNLIPLEETNNRFTTFCRRVLNSKGTSTYSKVGPLYYIIEMLEKIADEYKYLYMNLSEAKVKKDIVNKDLLTCFDDICKILRKFYTLFYKFNPALVSELRDDRKSVVDSLKVTCTKINKSHDIVLFQHLMVLNSNIFSLLGPYLILAINGHK